MIGRADIEGSKSDVAMNTWPPQASYPCGNFSDTSCLKLVKRSKGSIDRAFAARIRTENQDQASFCSFTLREVSVLAELALGHLHYHLTDVPPQSNSPPNTVLGGDRARVWMPTSGSSGDTSLGPPGGGRQKSARGEASQHSLELETQRHWPTLGARLRFHFTE